jgi:AcrR family transcriptional regulator
MRFLIPRWLFPFTFSVADSCSARGASNPPPTKRWQRRKAARPAEIVSAALELFASKGYAATTLDDIAQKAGITRGLVLFYFRDKKKVLEAVLAASHQTNHSESQAILKTHRSEPEKCLRALLEYFSAQIQENSALLRLVVAESANHPEAFRREHKELAIAGEPLLTKVLRSGIRSGAFRKVPPDETARWLLAPILLEAIVRPAQPQRSRIGVWRQLASRHLDVLLAGLRAR